MINGENIKRNGKKKEDTMLMLCGGINNSQLIKLLPF